MFYCDPSRGLANDRESLACPHVTTLISWLRLEGVGTGFPAQADMVS